MGVANSFAGGVFLAIAFAHILPEAAGDYAELKGDEAFPLPYVLTFIGYSIILFMDKVMYDSSQLMFENEGSDKIADPAAQKF